MADPKRYRPKFGIDIRINPDVPKKAKKKVERCSAPGCVGEAETRVPKSRDKMEERVWLCRAHLKVHNESWDFFAGMSDDDIQRYCVESLTGHRPTWPLGKRAAGDKARPDPVWNYHVQDGNAAFEGSTHVTEPERAALTSLRELGLTDVMPRSLKGNPYTFWDYRNGALHRGWGMRIDLIYANAGFAGHVTDAYIDRDERKGKGASDHAPVVVDLDLG